MRFLSILLIVIANSASAETQLACKVTETCIFGEACSVPDLSLLFFDDETGLEIRTPAGDLFARYDQTGKSENGIRAFAGPDGLKSYSFYTMSPDGTLVMTNHKLTGDSDARVALIRWKCEQI